MTCVFADPSREPALERASPAVGGREGWYLYDPG
jgi:hypothetical protein